MDLSLQKLEQAISLRKRIHQLEGQFAKLFGGATHSGGAGRHISPQTRAKLAAAGRRRWAGRKRKSETGAASSSSPRKKGGLTAAGRRKLSQLMKARWAAKRKGQKK